MEQFNIKQDWFKEYRRAIIIKAASFILLAILGGLAISYFVINRQHDEVNIYPIVIPMVLVMSIFGVYQGIKRQRKIFDGYRLTIDNNSITREQYNTPTITIPLADISEISKHPKGSFTIKGNSTINAIYIPTHIENYEKLEQLLSEIKPVSYKDKKTLLQKFEGLLIILTIGLMVVVFLINDKIIVGICGTLLLMFLGYSLFVTQKSKNVDKKTKKGMWMVIVVMVSIILIMYAKIMR